MANLLDEEVQVNKALFDQMLRQPPLSHSTTAIYAADSWQSDNSTAEDVYDTIVKTSREVSHMCESLDSLSLPPSLSRNLNLQLVRCGSR